MFGDVLVWNTVDFMPLHYISMHRDAVHTSSMPAAAALVLCRPLDAWLPETQSVVGLGLAFCAGCAIVRFPTHVGVGGCMYTSIMYGLLVCVAVVAIYIGF